MIVVGALRAADRDARPDRVLALRREAGAVAGPLLRHDRSGHGHLLAGRLGHPDLALPRRRGGRCSRRALAATLGVLGAYCGGWVDDLVNFATNVFLVIPTIPLLVVVSAYLKSRGSTSMILILGLTLWAFEARILRAQALTLRNRDFILAAKVAGESTLADHLPRADAEHDQPHRRGVRARLLRLDPDRGGARVPRARQHEHRRAGASRCTGRRSTRACCRASGGRSCSRGSRSR